MNELITLHIENLCFEAIIGLLEHERITPQEVLIEVKISYVYAEGAYLDYARLCVLITEHIQANAYELIESALLGTIEAIKSQSKYIKSIWLFIKKPQILSPTIVGASMMKEY